MVKESLAKYIEDSGNNFVERKVKFKPDQAEKIHKFVNIGNQTNLILPLLLYNPLLLSFSLITKMTKMYVFSNRIKMKKSDYFHQNQRCAGSQVTILGCSNVGEECLRKCTGPTMKCDKIHSKEAIVTWPGMHFVLKIWHFRKFTHQHTFFTKIFRQHRDSFIWFSLNIS